MFNSALNTGASDTENILGDLGETAQIKGEFRILKPFLPKTKAKYFTVENPVIAEGTDYVIYTVKGLDPRGNPFEVFRRYSEFLLFR